MRIKRNNVDNSAVKIDYKQCIVPYAKILWWNIEESINTDR